jgi:hypothetical protein
MKDNGKVEIKMKKALVHDLFSVYPGAEKCVEGFTKIMEKLNGR